MAVSDGEGASERVEVNDVRPWRRLRAWWAPAKWVGAARAHSTRVHDQPAHGRRRHFRGVPVRWLRRAATVIVVLALVLGAVAARLETMTPPPLGQTVVLAGAVRFPGPKPKVAWPYDGEAAVTVEGVGSLGSVGGGGAEPIASLAKVMTAYLILRDHPLAVGATGFVVTISAAEVADRDVRLALGQSTVPVAVGEKLDEYQLLVGLLLPSANNVAEILASYDAGTVAAFVSKMNAAARALRMDHTDYSDPSGFMPTTVSTAADQLRLAKVAMRTPIFARIVGLTSAVLPVAGTVTNYNGLVGKDGFIGIKTGSESQAGGCLAFADRRRVGGHGVTIVGVVLGQDRGGSNPGVILSAVLGASAGLADSVAAALRVRTVLGAGRAVTEITNAEGDQVVAITSDPVEQLGWGGLRLPVRVTNMRPLRHLAAGQPVATVVLGGRLTASTPVAATASMPRLRLAWRARHLW